MIPGFHPNNREALVLILFLRRELLTSFSLFAIVHQKVSYIDQERESYPILNSMIGFTFLHHGFGTEHEVVNPQFSVH